MRVRIVPAAEILGGSPLRLYIKLSLLPADYVGDPEGLKKEIARLDLQRRKVEGHLRNLNEELVRHEACSPLNNSTHHSTEGK